MTFTGTSGVLDGIARDRDVARRRRLIGRFGCDVDAGKVRAVAFDVVVGDLDVLGTDRCYAPAPEVISDNVVGDPDIAGFIAGPTRTTTNASRLNGEIGSRENGCEASAVFFVLFGLHSSR
jgi:hypothetical protein